MTNEQKLILITVIFMCLFFLGIVLYYVKKQEAKSLKRDYDKLFGDYNHLNDSVNLISRIKQTESMKTKFVADVEIGEKIFTKEYSKDGNVMSGKVISICWFGSDDYTFIVSFKDDDITLEFPSSALGATAFFTEKVAREAEVKHTYSDFNSEKGKFENEDMSTTHD